MSQITHDNHYVPQFYLRLWSEDGLQLLTYDAVVSSESQRLWRSAPIKSSACWKDLYTTLDDDDAECDDIEKHIADEVETPAVGPFGKVSQGLALTEDDMGALVDFAIYQLARTPKWGAQMRDRLPEIFDRCSSRLADKLRASKRPSPDEVQESKAAQPMGFPRPEMPLSVELDESDEASITTELGLLVGRQATLSSLGSFVDGPAGSVLRGYHWIVLTMPEGCELVTSDAPVVVCARDALGRVITEGLGLVEPGVSIFMPLDSGHALFTAAGISSQVIDGIEVTEKLFWVFQEAVIRNAFRYIYALRPDGATKELIEGVRPRTIDPNLAKDLENERKSWGEEQGNAEREFLRGGNWQECGAGPAGNDT